MDQGDNKSSTNRGPGQTDSDSQTRRVKSFGSLGPSGSLGRLGTLPFRSAAPHKALANQSFAESQAQRGSFVSDIIRRQGWLPMRCLLRGALPRSGTRAKEAGTKGAGISDAARRTIRRAKSNLNSPSWSSAVGSWSPKPSRLRSLAAPIRDADEGNGHKWSLNQPRGASRDSPAERQSEFASPWRRSQNMAPNALTPWLERLSPSSPL
jgi:hypothetical protein